MILVFTRAEIPIAALAAPMPIPGDRALVSTAGDPGDFSSADAVTALEYPCTLEGLDLRAGFLALAPSGGRTLPRSSRIYASAIGSDFDWKSAAPLDPTLAALHLALPPRDPCVPFDTERLQLEGTSHDTDGPTIAVAIDAGSALIGTNTGKFFRITLGPPARAERLTALSTSTPHLGAYRAPNGELWLAGDGGEVARGDPVHGFTPAPHLAGDAAALVRLDGPKDEGAPFEMFAETQIGTFEHFDGARWETIAVAPSVQSSRIALAWTATDHAIAIGSNPGGLIRYGDGNVNREDPDGELDEPTAVAVVPELGTVAGNGGGKLYLDDGRWSVIGGADVSVRVIIPLAHGFLFGGRYGVLTERVSDGETCGPMSSASDDVQLSFVLGGAENSVVGLVSTPARGAMEVSLLTRSREPGCF